MYRVPLDKVLNNSKPLLFESDDDFVPYWLSGTCVVGIYAQYGVVITARHAIAKGNEQRAAKLRIFATEDCSGLSLPIDKQVEITAAHEDHEDAADLEFARIALDKCTPEQLTFVANLDFGALRPAGTGCTHAPGKALAIPMMPDEFKSIDYDKNVLTWKRVIHGATLSDSIRLSEFIWQICPDQTRMNLFKEHRALPFWVSKSTTRTNTVLHLMAS